MTKDEIRMTKEARNRKDEGFVFRHAVLRHSFVIWISSFVIPRNEQVCSESLPGRPVKGFRLGFDPSCGPSYARPGKCRGSRSRLPDQASDHRRRRGRRLRGLGRASRVRRGLAWGSRAAAATAATGFTAAFAAALVAAEQVLEQFEDRAAIQLVALRLADLLAANRLTAGLRTAGLLAAGLRTAARLLAARLRTAARLLATRLRTAAGLLTAANLVAALRRTASRLAAAALRLRSKRARTGSPWPRTNP